MPKASKTLRASDILRTSRRRPVLAAIAVPTAAAAAITAAGFAAAPGAAEEPQAFESKAAPEAATDDAADKQRQDAQATAEKEQKKASSSMTLPEPEKSESETGERGSGSSGKSRSGKSGSSKPEPKANTKASRSGGTCKASYYWQGQKTANGEQFNTNDLTAAHKSLPFNSRVKVTNKANGKSVTVRINDRGPYIAGRCLDLSTAAMKAVGGTGAGVITVSYQVL